MKIKSQLILTITTFIIILGIIIVSIFYADRQASVLANDDAIIGNIESGISNLNHVSDFYLLYQQDSQLSDWQSNITALYGDVSQLNSTESNQKQTANTLWLDIQVVDNAYNDSSIYLESTSRNTTVRTAPEFQAVWSHLSDALQTFSNDSSTLSRSLHSQTDEVNRSNVLLIAILLVAFGAYLIVSYFIMFRRTLRTITRIDSSLRVIGTGDFEHQINAERNDELGELSNAVNTMRIRLKGITRQLKEQERLAGIGQTAGMVGHDLRNPLQALVGEIYLIEEELRTLPDSQSKVNLRESIQSISDQASYMDKIISDLQTFVKPVVTQKETVNLKQLVTSALSLISIPADVKAATGIAGDLTVNTDPQMLKRVLINLTNNAIQAMPKGGNLTITGQKTAQGKIHLTVQDTGVGIPDDIKPKIFTPLFTTKARGQGFGLAICKRVIEAQGGTITFESKVGKGTKFIIELP